MWVVNEVVGVVGLILIQERPADDIRALSLAYSIGLSMGEFSEGFPNAIRRALRMSPLIGTCNYNEQMRRANALVLATSEVALINGIFRQRHQELVTRVVSQTAPAGVVGTIAVSDLDLDSVRAQAVVDRYADPVEVSSERGEDFDYEGNLQTN